VRDDIDAVLSHGNDEDEADDDYDDYANYPRDTESDRARAMRLS
jgi:hypothetical protein